MAAPRGTHLHLLSLVSGLKHFLHCLTLTVNVASLFGAAIGFLSSLSSFFIWGTTVVMCSVLCTDFPIGPNITKQAQSSAATQLAFPHSILGLFWRPVRGNRAHHVNDLSSRPFYTPLYHTSSWLIAITLTSDRYSTLEDQTVTEQRANISITASSSTACTSKCPWYHTDSAVYLHSKAQQQDCNHPGVPTGEWLKEPVKLHLF